jgi:hypothetical protein
VLPVQPRRDNHKLNEATVLCNTYPTSLRCLLLDSVCIALDSSSVDTANDVVLANQDKVIDMSDALTLLSPALASKRIVCCFLA